MKKFLIYLIILLNGLLLLLCIDIKFYTPTISNIEYKDEINENNEQKVIVNIKNLKINNAKCSIDGKKWIKSDNNKCIYYLKDGFHKISVKNYNKIDNKDIKIDINKIESVNLNYNEYYLAVGEEFKLEEKIEKLGNPKYEIIWESSNNEIATVENGLVKGISNGEVEIKIKVDDKEDKCKIIVTDLIIPRTLDMNKKIVPCNIYSNEDNELLDKILESRVKEKGEGTRAALIETIRFLPLSLPYKIPYFFENGRLKTYGNQHYVDGEGRYYNKGLYLSENKKLNIKKSFAGPSIWGCPLTNYDTSYGWTFGGRYPNGLDCSGFVTWALYNSGLDVGDIGSGITENVDDVSDLGEMHELTYEFANSDDYKVGDIIARDGHTALIAGKDEENIYIAESLLKGVVIETFSYKNRNSKLYKLYGYINKLDNVYKGDGNYSNMW